MLSLLSPAGRDEQSFTSHRWEVGSGHGHFIRRGKGTPTAPWSWLGGTQLAVWQSKWLHFSKGFLSVITTAGHGFSFVRQQLAIQVTSPWAREGPGSFSQQIRLASPSYIARQRGSVLGEVPGQMGRNQSHWLCFWLPPLGSPLLVMLEAAEALWDCLLSIWCDAKAFQQSTSERRNINLTACMSAKYKWIFMGRSGEEKALSTPSTCLQLKISKAWYKQCC